LGHRLEPLIAPKKNPPHPQLGAYPSRRKPPKEKGPFGNQAKKDWVELTVWKRTSTKRESWGRVLEGAPLMARIAEGKQKVDEGGQEKSGGEFGKGDNMAFQCHKGKKRKNIKKFRATLLGGIEEGCGGRKKDVVANFT